MGTVQFIRKFAPSRECVWQVSNGQVTEPGNELGKLATVELRSMWKLNRPDSENKKIVHLVLNDFFIVQLILNMLF